MKLTAKYKIDFPFKKMNTLGQFRDCWNRMSNERMVGVLHGFLILKPFLKRAFQQLSRLEIAK
jgi:hypothetical protein